MNITDKQCMNATNLSEVISVVDDVFKSTDVSMVPKTYIGCKKGDFRAMPARVGDVAGIKWVSVFPENPPKQPSVLATILLNSLETGELLATLAGTYITKLRTAASAAVATRLLARSDSEVAAFIGCGAQTELHLEAILEVQPKIEKLSFFDVNPEAAEILAKRWQGIKKVVIANSVQNCVEGADIITTLTPSTEPVVFGKWLKDGVHINAMGADAEGKREFDSKTYKMVDIWTVDDFAQASHSGETQHAYKSRYGLNAEMPWPRESGKIITNMSECLGRTLHEQITLFDSTGIATQDIAVANYIYEKLRSG